MGLKLDQVHLGLDDYVIFPPSGQVQINQWKHNSVGATHAHSLDSVGKIAFAGQALLGVQDEA